MSSRAKAVVASLTVLVLILAGLLIWSDVDDGGTTKVSAVSEMDHELASQEKGELKERLLRKKIHAFEKENAAEARASERRLAKTKGVTGGGEGPPEKRSATNPGPDKTSLSSSSFASLEDEVTGEIGVAYSPLGPGSPNPQTLGPLQVGHAWSSFKVPISVTVMEQQGGTLTASQESLVSSAITASDNEAAAALFSELEAITDGGASSAVEQTLSTAGAPTEVATAPPPPGAVSSWGQTEWELSASTRFYNALACGAYEGATDTILRDMENVIPEQQWGLGQAPFPSGASVAYKAGWGPDGSESGPYLVRQAGIIQTAEGGAVVTIAAQDESGSFEAGVADLNRVADWVAGNVPLDGSC